MMFVWHSIMTFVWGFDVILKRQFIDVFGVKGEQDLAFIFGSLTDSLWTSFP